jgi:predicted HAD superfamily Cof-like phosphohydrolase
MKNEQNQIKEFMVKAGQQTPDKPEVPSIEVRKLRVKLIAEELLELCAAYCINLEIRDGSVSCVAYPSDVANLTEAYDAVLDLLVVTIGTGVAQGTDLQPGWDEVHRSNMSKFIDGHRREDGKWVKGPSYSPAQLSPILQAQAQTV